MIKFNRLTVGLKNNPLSKKNKGMWKVYMAVSNGSNCGNQLAPRCPVKTSTMATARAISTYIIGDLLRSGSYDMSTHSYSIIQALFRKNIATKSSIAAQFPVS